MMAATDSQQRRSYTCRSETEFRAILKLKRVEHVSPCTVTPVGIGRPFHIRGPVKRVEILDICTIEEVEEICAQIQSNTFVHAKCATDPKIDTCITRSFQRIPAKVSWAVR